MGRLAGLLLSMAVGALAAWWWLDGGDGVPREPVDDGSVNAGRDVAVDSDDDGAVDADDDDDDDDEPPLPQRLQTDGARRYVVLDAAERALAGIVTTLPASGDSWPERHVVGVVADSAALVAAQQGLAAARAQVAAEAAARATLGDRLERLRGLSGDNALGAARERAGLELAWQREQALMVTRDNEVAQRRQALQGEWGPALAAASTEDALRTALAAGRAALLLVVVPPGLPTPPLHPAAAAGHTRAAALPARVLGPAPRVPARAAGSGWWLLVEAAWPRDARVDVWLATSTAPVAGVLLPDSAMVWHAGRRWYFAEVAAGRYERRAVAHATAVDGGVLLPPAAAGTAVVTRGAQVLLAEELRGAIPDEDED